MSEDPLLAGKILPSRLHILMQRMAQGHAREEIDPQDEAPHEAYPRKEAFHESEEGENESEEGENDLLRNGEPPSSESEAG